MNLHGFSKAFKSIWDGVSAQLSEMLVVISLKYQRQVSILSKTSVSEQILPKLMALRSGSAVLCVQHQC